MFIIIVQWLYMTLKSIPKEEWENVVLAYDAMCKLDGLLVTSKPLPLPEPYDGMWKCIKKVCTHLMTFTKYSHYR